jgi:predicted histone-like DNA-binding protein
MAAIFVAAIVPNNLLNAKSMIRYKKYKSNQTGVTKNKWYGRAVTELMEFEEFVKHMANHHCVFGESTIRGVLIEMQICMRELLLEGKAVRLDDLGIFRIGLETSAATTAKEFTADNIKAVRLNLYLGKRFRAADLYKDAKFREAGKYDGGGDDGGETAGTHDEGNNTNGGNSSGDGDTSGGNMSDGGSTDDSAYVDL